MPLGHLSRPRSWYAACLRLHAKSLVGTNHVDVPVSSGTADKLVFRISANLAVGTSATLTLRKNHANTALTCTIGAGQSTCTDLAHQIAFGDGDTLSIRYNETGTPNVRVTYSLQYRTP
jgi:hypothetical protein